LDGQNLVIIGLDEIAESCGLEVGDQLIGFNGMEVTLQTAQQAFAGLHSLGVDEDFTIKVRRSEREREFTCAKRLVDRIERHVFRVDPGATPEQVALRTAWMKNLQPVDVIPSTKR
jgi:predicted metalloprotease with PDZ domain